jgi:hypothetical protein
MAMADKEATAAATQSRLMVLLSKLEKEKEDYYEKYMNEIILRETETAKKLDAIAKMEYAENEV